MAQLPMGYAGIPSSSRNMVLWSASVQASVLWSVVRFLFRCVDQAAGVQNTSCSLVFRDVHLFFQYFQKVFLNNHVWK